MVHREILPLVSVITPSYNGSLFLEQTIRSVLDQDYPHIEYIIIDGGSSDGSVDIIRRYADRLTYWVSEPDGGQADAINKGLRQARGDLLTWLNCDDTYTQGAIWRAVECMRRHPYAIAVHGGCNVVDENSRILRRGVRPGQFRLRDQLCGNIPCQPSVLMRRKPLFDVGLLDARLNYVMDFDLWLKLGLKGDFVAINSIQANYRVHCRSKSIAQVDSFLPEILLVLDRFFAQPDLPHQIRKVRRKAYSDFYAEEAPHSIYRPRHLMTPEKVRRMRRSLLTSIRYYPFRLKTLLTIAEIADSYLPPSHRPRLRNVVKLPYLLLENLRRP